MATEYTIKYTYTGQSNTGGKRSVDISKFKKTGDTDRNIGQITSISYRHYHTSTNPMDWGLRGRLVLSDGTTFTSNKVTKNISGNIVEYINTFNTLPTAEQFELLQKVQTLDNKSSTGDSGYSADLYWRATKDYPMVLTVKFIEDPPVTYAPKIEKFEVRRLNNSYKTDDEGERMGLTLKLSINDSAGKSGAQCRIYYAANTYPEVGVSQYVDLTSKISTLKTGITLDYNILTGLWSLGNVWNFAVVFTADKETAIATYSVARGTVSFHVSREHGGGAAVGGFSTGKTPDPETGKGPKFESYPPTYLYGGLAQVGNSEASRTALGIQAGATSSGVAAGANKTTETNFTFPTEFKSAPIVVVSFRSATTAATHGSIGVVADNVTTTGFTARICNNTSTERSPRVCWIAIGEM